MLNLFRRRPATDAPAAADTSLPSILGIWKVGQTLHRSADGVIATATPADGSGWPRMRHVIKTTLHGGGAVSPAALRAIRNQFDAAVVRHPNLVAVVDGSVDTARPYVVFDRLAGRSWAATDSASLGGCLFWSRQIAQALAALHEGGLIHGDVRAENVWIDQEGSAKLIDLARCTPIHCPLRPGQIDRAITTAPELFAGRTAATAAIDVHALGQTLKTQLTRIDRTAAGLTDPIGRLTDAMIDADPAARPTAGQAAQTLAELEMRLLESAIRPVAA